MRAREKIDYINVQISSTFRLTGYRGEVIEIPDKLWNTVERDFPGIFYKEKAMESPKNKMLSKECNK